MGSPFAAAMRVADRTLDAAFGEAFTVTPVTNGAAEDGDVNAAERPDPARPPRRVVMTYQEVGKDYFPAARGVAANTAQRRTGADLLISVLAERLPYPLRAGDRLLREGTGVTYRVAAVEPDDAVRVWLPVTVARPVAVEASP